MTLLIVDPSVERPERQATDRMDALVARLGGAAVVVRPVIDGGWGDVDLFDARWRGLVLMGSASSVHDPSDWRDALLALLGAVVRGERALPTLGICYGHQLLGRAAGAPVGWVRGGEKLVGVRDVEIVAPACPLLEPFAARRSAPLGTPTYRSAVSHSEHVERLPEGFALLTRHADCPVHGMQLAGRPVFGLQDHPEMPDSSLAGLAKDGLPDGALGDAQRDADGWALLERFFRLALEADPTVGS